MIKAVILIGGPDRGTRFRALSHDIPKPLFPVAGKPIIQHHIEACRRVKNLKEILLLGFYDEKEIQPFVNSMQILYDMSIRYLHEYAPLGTAGGIYHFRDQIRSGNPTGFFVLNGDVCADFPLQNLYDFHVSKGEKALITIMTTEATKQQSLDYGNLVLDKENGVTHFVEKPYSYVSHLINCGVYVASMDIFTKMAEVFYAKQQDYYTTYEDENKKDRAHMLWEREILTPLAGTGRMFALPVSSWWSQTKTAASAIYANRHYLALYKKFHPERLANAGFKASEDSDGSLICNIIPDVHIHPTASVHPTATLGPNVSIGPNAVIGPGVRIRESIILDDVTIKDHTLILHSIVGRSSRIGCWARVEGTPSDPDPNKPFAKMENPPLFNKEGRLNPSITILGFSVTVPSEMILLNSIVLPQKNLKCSFKNEIIL